MRTLQKLLLATDFRESSQRAAEVTVRLAKKFQATVTVLHVREAYPTWPISPYENQDLLTQKLTAQQIKLDEFQLHAGSPVEVVLRKAQEVQADILVIGAGEKLREGHLAMGPIAEMILEQSETPVLAINPHGPAVTFQNILCPVDHSATSRQGLEHAIELARAFGGRLVVLSVVPEVSWLAAALETGQLEGAKHEHEVKWLEEFQELLASVSFDGVQWEQRVLYGQPHEQILQTARELKVDTLVLGATGRSGIVRLLLGSVTRRVLNELPCSVLLVKDQYAFEDQYLVDLDVIERLLQEGQAHLRAGSPAEAAGRFRQVIALDPYHAEALDGLVLACEQLDQTDKAHRYRQRADRVRQ